MKRTILILTTAILCLICGGSVSAQSYKLETDIYYRDASADEYAQERCKLDIYWPEETQGFSTLVWFHGGGLVGGNKYIPDLLKEKGICVVSVNYRLSPKGKCPAFFEDAAASVAWTVENIAKYGGDPSKIYVGGHSAGGYLTSVIALDKSYLGDYGIDADDIKGYFPVSGQTITHVEVLRQLGLPEKTPHIDKYAPIAHVRQNTPPIVLIVGQHDRELPCRVVENKFLYDAMKHNGNDNVIFHEINGFDHGSVHDPGLLLILEHIRKN